MDHTQQTINPDTPTTTTTTTGHQDQINLKTTTMMNWTGVFRLAFFLVGIAARTVSAAPAKDDILSSHTTALRQLRGGHQLQLPFHDGDKDNHRSLMQQCTTDPELKKDKVWYEIELDVFSMFELKCSEDEWTDMRVFLEAEMDKIDLFDEFQIEELNPNLCNDPDATNQRRGRRQKRKLVVQSLEDPSVPDLILDEDDERFLQYMNASEHEDGENQRQLFKVFIVWYDLFFKGGSICSFCFRDNRDWNSRHRSLETKGEDAKTAGKANVSMAIGSGETDSDHNDSNNNDDNNEAGSLRFPAGHDEVDSFPKAGNPSLSNNHSSMNEKKKEANMYSTTTTQHGSDTADFPPTLSRQLKCRGCFRLN